jgi:hypothetical protein
VDKLSIANEMACFDRKDRDFYDNLTDEEKKKFSNFLMIGWGSSVNGIKEMQEYYLIATNERLNKHFFDMSKHPKLQWLCATTVSPDMGIQKHNWISGKKKDTGDNIIGKQLGELFPNLPDDSLDVMAIVNTKKDINEYLKKLGKDTKK